MLPGNRTPDGRGRGEGRRSPANIDSYQYRFRDAAAGGGSESSRRGRQQGGTSTLRRREEEAKLHRSMRPRGTALCCLYPRLDFGLDLFRFLDHCALHLPRSGVCGVQCLSGRFNILSFFILSFSAPHGNMQFAAKPLNVVTGASLCVFFVFF